MSSFFCHSCPNEILLRFSSSVEYEICENKIKFEYDKRRPGDSEKLVSNVDKLHKYIKWKPKFDKLNLIIRTAIDWERKIYEKNL